MKKVLSICILAIVLSAFGTSFKPITLDPLTFNAAAIVNTAINPQSLRLVFNEDFTGPRLRSTKWMTQLQWGRTNDPELQYYDPNAFSFKNGAILIKAQRKWSNGKPYTSGALVTYKSFKFTYGVVKIRARIPAGRGLWPALWLLDYAGGAQEIDIMESVGHEPNIIYMSLHYPTPNGNQNIGGHFAGRNFSTKYHLFTVDWSPKSITWYIDGVKRYSTTEHIPTKPMYLIMNLAVGGDWPGSPTSSTKFPAYLNIDYVKIYKKR